MIILAIFLINSGLNFLLGLLLAKVLGPDNFGRYAVAMAIAVLVNSVIFDWVRLSAARFYSEKIRTEQPAIRASLDLLVALATLSTFSVLGLLVIIGVDLRIPPTLAGAAAAAGVTMALFDFAMTLTRARFLDRMYSRAVIVKNVAAFMLMIGMAISTNDPVAVLCASVVSSAMAIFLIRHVLREDNVTARQGQWPLVKKFALYGMPLMLANMFYQFMSFISRAFIVDDYGYGEAGQFALASDMGQRIFSTLGSALDILLFQLAVRADESHGREEGRKQVSNNFSMVFALLAPLAAGYWMILPSFEAALVPQAFRGQFAAYSEILAPALFCFGLILYGLNPTFQIARRTLPVVIAAAGAMAVNVAVSLWLSPRIGPMAFAWAQLAGYFCGAVLIALAAFRFAPIQINVRDIVLIVIATGIMCAALWPLRAMTPGVGLLSVMVFAGAAIYGLIIFAADAAGLRTLAADALAKRRAR